MNTKEQDALFQLHTSFVPVPDKVNVTQLMYEYNRFCRTLQWREFWAKMDNSVTPTQTSQVNEKSDVVKIFNIKKHNLPSDNPSRPLANLMYGVKSDLLAWDKEKNYSNLSLGLKKARDELINLQKSGSIVIQCSDKGGAITKMDRSDYIQAVEEEHLQSKVTLKDGSVIKVYEEVQMSLLKSQHATIKNCIENAVDNSLITKEIGKAMVTDEPAEGRAYAMPKAHKEIREGRKLPPTRLVISGCGSNTEHISHFINHHTKHIPEMLPSHIQDTPDLLRMVEELNQNKIQDKNAFPVTLDVVGLYPNIPQKDGMEAFKEAISDPKHKVEQGLINFLITLMQFVLSFNIFTFNDLLYIQKWGTAIGTKVAPTYANIFMGLLEEKILSSWTGRPPDIWKRYIDDIITIWSGLESELFEFLTFINTFHSTIKFTASYRTHEHDVSVLWKNDKLVVKRVPLGILRPRSIDFLDTNLWINSEGKILTDLFVKDSDRVTYLMPQSCHPGHITRNIPFSLGYRLKRICTLESDFLKRWKELTIDLKSRGYKEQILKAAFNRLEKVTRSEALVKANRKRGDNRIVFPITYDPRLPSISKSLHKHYDLAKKDPKFVKAIPVCPTVAYKRSRNLGEYLIRAKLYPLESYSMRKRNGFIRCTKKDLGCELCKYSKNSNIHVSSKTKIKYDIKSQIRCNDSYVIYSITCKKCPDVEYVGQTSQPIYKRFYSHSSDITNQKIDKPVPEHFNKPGHKLSDMCFLPFEKLRKQDKTLLTVRERFWIEEKQTLKFGLNKI